MQKYKFFEIQVFQNIEYFQGAMLVYCLSTFDKSFCDAGIYQKKKNNKKKGG